MFISNTLDRNQIIKSYGEFEQEKNVLKRMARIGQNLSDTVPIVDLTVSQINNKLLDIKDYSLKYIFTDGCGNISQELAELVDKEFGLLKCAAYQIRLGGVKGVLMLKPEL